MFVSHSVYHVLLKFFRVYSPIIVDQDEDWWSMEVKDAKKFRRNVLVKTFISLYDALEDVYKNSMQLIVFNKFCSKFQ